MNSWEVWLLMNSAYRFMPHNLGNKYVLFTIA